MTNAAEDSLYETGTAIRREVMGSAHVDRSLAAATEFSEAIQRWVTAFGWGTTWSRPGLERKTRSLITIAMLTALNRMQELRGHVRGAVNNGCTPDEIREVLLQSAVYCGAPAALEAFRNADAVLQELAGEA